MGQALSIARMIDPVTMAERVMRYAPASDADVLKLLRTSFPDHPLSARVAALDFLLRRRGNSATTYSPR